LTVWRAAAEVDPWLGYLGFWATSEHGARRFSSWISRPEHQAAVAAFGEVERLGRRAIYRAEVTVPSDRVLDLSLPIFVSPSAILAKAEELVGRGLLWVLFYEDVNEDEVIGEALYLGREPVPCERVTVTP
jgi:hypothetical protein